MTTDQFHEHVITRLDRIEAMLQPRKSESAAAARRQQRLRARRLQSLEGVSTIKDTSVNTSLVNS